MRGRPCGRRACALPGGFVQVACDMRGESRQVEHHRWVGRTLATVSEIVLRVVPVSLGMFRPPGPALKDTEADGSVRAPRICSTMPVR